MVPVLEAIGNFRATNATLIKFYKIKVVILITVLNFPHSTRTKELVYSFSLKLSLYAAVEK